MCTVTFIPLNKTDFVLTSNRDEAPNRISLVPEFYDLDGVKVLFPKDKLAGGTWIGTSGKNRVLCVLNGGFMLHKRQATYRLSRGIIVKDLLVTDNLEVSVSKYDFENIEPFTLVIVDWNDSMKLFELVWDGTRKHFTELPIEPRLWSSSTLYSENMKKERQDWFLDFKLQNKFTSFDILQFHNEAGKGNKEYGVVMDRGFVKTTSITQIVKNNTLVKMQFNDLNKENVTTKTFNSLETINE